MKCYSIAASCFYAPVLLGYVQDQLLLLLSQRVGVVTRRVKGCARVGLGLISAFRDDDEHTDIPSMVLKLTI